MAKDVNWLPLVMHAMEEAKVKHGPLTREPCRATVILVEEVGEVADAILTMTRPDGLGLRIHTIHELAQVAATAILMIQNLLEEGP